MSYLDIFRLEFGKTIWICHIWNHYPRIGLTAKFRGIMQMAKFDTKNTLFGYIWARI